MRNIFRSLAVFAALAVLALATPQALAQGGEEAPNEPGSVTFKLELRGDIPADERFGVFYQIVPPRGGGGGSGILLCGFEPGDPSYTDGGEVSPDLPKCDSSTKHELQFGPPIGIGYRYSYFRFPSGSDLSIGNPDAEIFDEGTVFVAEISVVSAYCNYGDGQVDAPGMPNTGGGLSKVSTSARCVSGGGLR